VATIPALVVQQVSATTTASPSLDVYANVDGKTGSVASDVRRLIPEFEKKLPRGSTIRLRGQVESMDSSFIGLGIG